MASVAEGAAMSSARAPLAKVAARAKGKDVILTLEG